ncbi:MAG: RadC family protein [Patescibacteria group bacterium]
MAKMKNIPRIDRPREKLEKYGPEKLSDAELMAVLLQNGTKEKDVLEISRKVLRKFCGGKILEASFKDLEKTYGLGKAKAAEIIACFELGKRFLKDKQTEMILSPKDVFENLRDIRDNKREHFVVFFLDARNQEIQKEIISIGTLNASLVHPREVFEPAVRHSAAQILLSHNHPSGDTEPSDDDVEITKRLQEAGKIMGIEVVDHVIVTSNSFLSLKCEGWMK